MAHLLWSTDYDGAYGIAIDGNGNVYVAGYSHIPWNGPDGQSPLNSFTGSEVDLFVLKLNSSGAYQWHTFYGSGSIDNCLGIATDGNGNVYVTDLAISPGMARMDSHRFMLTA